MRTHVLAVAVAALVAGCQPSLKYDADPDGGDTPAPDASSTLDTQLTLTPHAFSTVTTPRFEFTSDPPGAGFLCSVDFAIASECGSPQILSPLADGPHTFTVAAIHGGLQDATPANYRWTVDTMPPVVHVDTPPPAVDNDLHPTITFHSDEPEVVFGCTVDDVAISTCQSPLTVDVADGPHTLVLDATDRAGNQSPATTVQWTVDSSTPGTTLTQYPSGSIASTAASFGFTASNAGASPTFECSRDGAAYTGCSSPMQLGNFTEATHTFAVRAKNAAGTVDPTPAQATWTVDLTPPDTQIVSGPSGAVATTIASFSVSSSEGGTTFQCTLDQQPTQPCNNSPQFPNLGQGTHTLEVAAVDAANNVDPTPATASWTVDTVAPTVSLTNGPGSGQEVGFTFTTTEGTTTCSLDNSSFAPCTSPVSYTVTAGSHTFTVQASDAAGNHNAVVSPWTATCSQLTGGPGAYAFFHLDTSTQIVYDGINERNAWLGTGSNTEVSDPTHTVGRWGGAAHFVGTDNDVITWSAGPSTHDFTIEMWVKPVAGAGYQSLATGGGVFLDMDAPAGTSTATFTFGLQSDTSQVQAGGGSASAGAWHLIEATFSGTVSSIYVDGVLSGSHGFLTRTAPYDLSTLGFGGNDTLTADVDEIFVGTTGFTPADAAARYCAP